MSSQSIHVRPDAERVALLDAIRAKERTKPSRNAMATILLGDAIDREAERLNLHAWTERKAPTAADIKRRADALRDPGPPTLVIGDEIVIPGGGSAETVVERYRRLLAASGMTQAALERHLGLSSRGKLQHALRRGEVPPEVEAWMREREGGGR